MNTKISISNSTELKHRVMQLRADKFAQEEELKRSFKEMFYSLSPVAMAKKAVSELSRDKEFQHGILNSGINIGFDFLLAKIIGRGASLKGYVTSILLGKLFKNNSEKILSVVGDKVSQFFKARKNEKSF